MRKGKGDAKVILACAVLISLAQAEPDKHELLLQAISMSAQDAAVLEGQIKSGTNEPGARYKLSYYYASNQKYSEASPHYLWLVENHPASSLLDQPIFSLWQMSDEDQQRAIDLWTKHIQRNAENVAIIANAADAFMFNDRPRAIELLERAAQLDNRNPEWHRRLGQLYSFAARSYSVDAAAAKESFSSYEQALLLSKPADRFDILEDAAKAALAAGEIDTARQYANELLDRSIETPQAWNYGNAVHHGNLILGHAALRDGRIEDAEEFLLRAGKTPGAPTLNSFGPNMHLALELLQKDRKDRVLEYLRLCQKFWNRPELGAWIKTVESGGIPAFGGNLNY